MPSTLGKLVEVLSNLTDRTPNLDVPRCVNQIHMQAGQCTNCVNACPVEAISLTPTPQIDPIKCLACDACTTVCPTSALLGQRSPIDIWREARQLTQSDTAKLVCRAVGADDFEAVRIPCVSALVVEFYISLALNGIEYLIVYKANCENCPLQDSLTLAQKNFNDAKQFLAKLKINLEVTFEISMPPLKKTKASGLSRRGFFSTLFATNSSISKEANTLDKLLVTGVGWRRAMLLHDLLQTPIPNEIYLPTQHGYWGAVVVNDQCVGCGMCTQFCPTNALMTTFNEQEKSISLLFCAASCTACGLCERACYRQAIKFRDDVAMSELTSCEFVCIWHGKQSFNPLQSFSKRAKFP
jgi:ferredoxin